MKTGPITGIVVSMGGTPRPQPRPRFVGGRVISTASRKAKGYATALERRAREAVANLGGGDAVKAAFAGHALALRLLLSFYTPDTTRWGKPHTIRPDADNCAKLVTDCLMRAGALGGDDSRVASVTVQKVWTAREGFTSIVIDIVDTTRKATTRPATPASVTLAAPPAWLRR